jgi:hypothetical protein
MSGDSNLGGDGHWFLRASSIVLSVIRLALRVVKKDALNPPELPASIIAGWCGSGTSKKGDLDGKYFILDDEKQSSALSLNQDEQKKVCRRICDT